VIPLPTLASAVASFGDKRSFCMFAPSYGARSRNLTSSIPPGLAKTYQIVLWHAIEERHMFSAIQPVQRSLNKFEASAAVHQLAAGRGMPPFSVRLADGTNLIETPGAQFTLVVRDSNVLAKLLDSPDELALGELFISGDLEVEGDLDAALQLAESLTSHGSRPTQQQKLRRAPAVLIPLHARGDNLKGTLHSRERDRAAVASHYDVSNAFYRLWLDPNLVYSEAYFQSPDQPLDAAQIYKLDYVCRKLRLKRGDRFLDIGCGWAGLVIHAASHYGVDALGITVSDNQAELGSERIRKLGLEDHCAVRISDYRDTEKSKTYDKIASVGMFEHVGQSMLKPYFDEIFRLLPPGGVFFNSGISASATYKREGRSFMDEYVFPDGELVPLHVAIREAELSGFEVRDVEDLSEHYALTLDRWVQRLEEHSQEARQVTDDVTYRTWKLYMAASAHGFRVGRIHLYHLLLWKPGQDQHFPLTRKDWYHGMGLGDQARLSSL
jgi:cyclopropane-fatty-acyl-phospholipid synthase